VTKGNPSTPKKTASEANDDEDDENEQEVEEVETKKKGKSIMGSLKKLTKRKTADRSPEASSSQQPSVRQRLVGVVIPPPPLPYSSYIQFGERSRAPSSISTSLAEPPLPSSSSPSLVSLESARTDDSTRNFDAERYRLLYRQSQEELTRREDEHAARERRLREQMEVERAMYEAHINELRRQGGGSSSGRRG